MNIEEIKERSKGITEYMHPEDKVEIYRKDVSYLLSIIKQVEMDLTHMKEHEDVRNLGLDKVKFNPYLERSLKAIRGN